MLNAIKDELRDVHMFVSLFFLNIMKSVPHLGINYYSLIFGVHVHVDSTISRGF